MTQLDLQAHHPEYDERSPDWRLMSDCYAGQRAIKACGETYLPPTSGMVQKGMGAGEVGRKAYDAYKLRAVFRDFVAQAITGLAGVIHRKPPKVKVPKALEPMVQSMTIAGESLELLWARITEAQLEHGRGGLLVDVTDGAGVDKAMPYVALYRAPTILNWQSGERIEGRDSLGLVVLDESTSEMGADLTWAPVTQIRVLARGSVAAKLGADGEENAAAIASSNYMVAEARQAGDAKALELGAWKTPAIAGVPLERVPFVFFNTNDTTPTPSEPPLLGLANLSITVYLAEADYRQSLYLQSQDTLVLTGFSKEERKEVKLGAGAIIWAPMNGSAQFIGVSAAGLGEQRQALENDKAQAATFVVQLLDAGGGKSAESGEALRVRVSARTATLHSMQNTAAAAIRDCLVHAARWLKLPQEAIDGIEITPNTDFTDDVADPTVVKVLAEAKQAGAPISWETIHRWMRLHEVTEKSFDEEQEQIAAEETDAPTGETTVDIDPTGGRKPELAA